MSKREEVLQALFERLLALKNVDVRRNEVLPLKIPASGLVVLRDGNIGEPTILLSPPCFLYQHRAEIEVVVQQTSAADNDAQLDCVLEKIGQLIMSNVTLSGLIDHMHAAPPEFIEQSVEGGLNIKGATVPIVLEYSSINTLL
ncbi:MAG: acyl-CoA transferase [Alphaproteobacteria bacterium]|nr:acyl-CoA transferase [Alphaproteobacteria bacterium]